MKILVVLNSGELDVMHADQACRLQGLGLLPRQEMKVQTAINKNSMPIPLGRHATFEMLVTEHLDNLAKA